MQEKPPFLEAVYEVLYSKPHQFYYDERFHPGMGKFVALHGWRSIVKATIGEYSACAEVIVGLNRAATEQSAREFAYMGVIDKMMADIDETRRLVPHA